MKLTKSGLKQLIRETFEETYDDPMVDLGSMAIPPNKNRAAQKALEDLRSFGLSGGKGGEDVQRAINQLVNALNDVGFDVQFPSGRIRRP